MENVITSVGWSPNGEVFAVGSFNILRLCDKTGWTHCRERFQCGSVMNIAWTADGTQLAGAAGCGSVIFAQVVGSRFEWKNTEVTVLQPRKIRVQDATMETLEEIEFARDRVVEIGVGYDSLVVTTTSQCFIYSLQNLNTPIIFDLRAPPHFLHLTKRHFLSLDQISGIQVISYEGKVLSAPKFQGLRPDYLTKDMVALSPEYVAVVDSVDAKNIYVLDAVTGRQVSKLTHTSAEVVALALNQQSAGPQDRLLTFVDRNRDMFIVSLNLTGSTGQITPSMIFKLHSHVESFHFNDETDILVGLADGRLNTWHLPGIPFVDRDLLPLTTTSVDATEYGRNSHIVAFTGNRVSIRKVDGSLLFTSVASDVLLLYELSRGNKWEECLRLCRNQRSTILWGTLAGMSLAKKHLDTVEVCLGEVQEVAKLEYIQYIKSVPSEEGRQAELALFRRQPDDAERILLQATPPLIYRAIKMNIRLYRWARALDIAVKNRCHIDTVVGYRKKYLDQFEMDERDPKFLSQMSQVGTDWDVIDANEARELEDERLRGSGSRPRK
jgi:intraflagellar transport protein 80